MIWIIVALFAGFIIGWFMFAVIANNRCGGCALKQAVKEVEDDS